jgi:zinc protease
MPSDSALRAVSANARSAELTAYRDNTAAGTLVPNRPPAGRIVRERRIAPLDVTEWVLSNGVRVLVKETDFKADEILIAGVSLGGVSGLSPERYYSGRLAPLILERGGAGSIDADALQKMLAGKRAAVSAEIGDRDESISGQASPRDLETFFEVLWARVVTPRIDQSSFLAFKQQYSGLVKDRANSPMAAFIDTIGETMSQKHPLAKPVSDSLVQTLNVEIARDVFTDRFRDFSDFTFVIVGAVRTDALRPVVEKWLGALPAGGRVETPRDPGIRPPGGSITKVVRKGVDPKAQTSVIISGEIPWSRDAGIQAAAISEILNVRMRGTLREDLGGTYGVGVATALSRWPSGRFSTSISFGSAPERVDSLREVALSVLRKFAQEGPTADELAKVRESMLRSRETALRENEFWMELLQSEALWGDDPVETFGAYAARVRALDAPGLQAFARIVFNETNIARFTLMPEKNSRTP